VTTEQLNDLADINVFLASAGMVMNNHRVRPSTKHQIVRRQTLA
jgi:hypothetical protein